MNKSLPAKEKVPLKQRTHNTLVYLRQHWQLYLIFMLPAFVLTIIFRYIPMGGVAIAFMDYNPFRGLWHSEWVGFEHFNRFLSSPDFMRYLMNTLKLSVFGLLWGFPAPILLAFLLNRILSSKIKQKVQLVLYMIAAASITEARMAEGWIFSDGYFTGTQSMAVAEGTPIKGFEDLAGHTVAVKGGTLSEEYASSLAEQYGFKVQTFGSTLAVFMAVTGGQCAACFDDTPVIEDYIRDGGVLLNLVDGTANEGAEYGFAVFSPDKQELVDKINAGLANIKASGAYDEILARYLSK